MKDQLRTPVWLWLNLLSLDAPLVALVWQDFLARCYPSVLLPAGRWALGLSVWAIYLSDRLLDIRSGPGSGETIAHRFCRQNRRWMEGLLAAALAGDIAVGLLWLRPAVIANGLFVCAGVLAYMRMFPVRRMAPPWKPLAASVLFAAGVFVVAWTGSPAPEQILSGPMAAFCALCLANLVLISRWAAGGPSADILAWILLLVAVCALAGGTAWYAAIALSGGGLALLTQFGAALSGAARRTLADAALLTPLLFL